MLIEKTLKTTLALAVLAMAALDTAWAQQGETLSAAQIQSDIALAEKAYSRIHPGYTRYASAAEMSEAWDRLETRAEGGMSTGAFYLGIQQVLAEIRCDHTKANLPKSLIATRAQSPVYLPMRWSLVNGRGLIRLAGDDTGLAFGDEIIAINGRPLTDMIKEVSPFIPVDGYTEWSRKGGISESLEFQGGAIDHFGALLWDIEPKVNLSIETMNGTRKNIMADRISFKDWSELGAADGVTRNFKDAVTFDRIGDKGAYLKIDTFVNYREPVKPKIIYDPIFNALKDENREFLILDLRANGGGSDDASRGLLNRLMPKRKAFNKDVRVASLDFDGLREHLWTWDKSAFKPKRIAFSENKDGSYSFRKMAGQHGKIKPTKNAFKGRLIVLTSSSNSSGSAAILAHLKDAGRAIFIGEAAGGSAEGPTAGILFTLTLPESGIKTRIPAIRSYHNIEHFEPGLSISPDIKTPLTVEDYRARRDPALEAALKLIEDET